MDAAAEPTGTPSPHARARLARAVGHSVGLIVATLLAYAIWRGYQNPDLLLELSAFRIC